MNTDFRKQEDLVELQMLFLICENLCSSVAKRGREAFNYTKFGLIRPNYGILK